MSRGIAVLTAVIALAGSGVAFGATVLSRSSSPRIVLVRQRDGRFFVDFQAAGIMCSYVKRFPSQVACWNPAKFGPGDYTVVSTRRWVGIYLYNVATPVAYRYQP